MAKRMSGLSSYRQVRENDIASASSPTELMTMLFDKACVLLKTAIQAMEVDDDQAFHQATLHALQIVLLCVSCLILKAMASFPRVCSLPIQRSPLA